MCVPIMEPNVQLSEDDLKRIADAAGAGTTPGATPGSTTTAAGRSPAGKAEGGTVTEAGNPGESGGSTPAELINQQLAAQVADLQGQGNLLNQQIAQQAEGFQSVTQGILDSQKLAADALKSGFLDLTEVQKKAMSDAETLRKNTGQAQRKPNYNVSLKANKRANAGGVTATMLSGLGGVPTNTLTLGKASLLGGGA